MNVVQNLATCLVVLSSSLACAQQNSRAVYLDPKAPIAKRVQDLLGRMTIEEKVAQLQSGVRMPSLGPAAGSLFGKDGLNEDNA